MKKFMLELFSNRFGIVLATINACMLAAQLRYVNHMDVDVFLLNLPAGIAAFGILSVIHLVGIRVAWPLESNSMGVALWLFFSILQWLAIALFARQAAAYITRRFFSQRS